MILVDANILLYAEDSHSEAHTSARRWWDEKLSGSAPVCLCWPVIKAFLRIGTNHRVLESPLTIKEACQRVRQWFEQPCVRVLQPTENHWSIFEKMLGEAGAAGNLVSDAHLAALAVEHNCVLYFSDCDFARFPGLRWENPLSARE